MQGAWHFNGKLNKARMESPQTLLPKQTSLLGTFSPLVPVEKLLGLCLLKASFHCLSQVKSWTLILLRCGLYLYEAF